MSGANETDNFSHRAGYHADPLAVAIKQARKGGTLAAGEGALLVAEIDRLNDKHKPVLEFATWAESKIARLRNANADLTDDFVGVVAEIDRLHAAVEQVRTLHAKIFWGNDDYHECLLCEEPYPCHTLRALDGDV